MRRTMETSAGRISYELIRTVHPQARAAALPGGRVCVYAPAGFTLRQADALVQKQADALLDRLARLDGPQCVGGRALLEGVVYDLHAETSRAQLHALAAQRITQRLAHYHALIGGEYASVSVEEMGVKWGVCTQSRKLHFNYRLILAPPEALDYVVIHELCHLHEFSHSPRFWRLVQAQMPDYKAWKAWLAAHKSELQP